MENASLKTLFDALPNEDHDRVEAAANRYHYERTLIGPVRATRNFFLAFLASFPGAIFWSDEEIAQGIDQAQQTLASLNSLNNSDVVIHPTSPTHPAQQPLLMGASQTSGEIPKEHCKPDTSQPGQNTSPRQPPGIQPPAFQPSVVRLFVVRPSANPPSLIRPSANQSVLPPSPVESQELAAASPQKMSQSQTQALATPSPSPSSSGTNQPQPLEIPYLGKICDICDADFVWKKTAERCFMCLENKPSHEKIAEILERAMRGIDSCSNCYGEADRGDNMHCHHCHERQKLKTKRHAAKIKARRARQAAQAPPTVLGGSANQHTVQPPSHQQPNYPQQSYPQQSYPQQSYPQQSYPQQTHQQQKHPQQSYPQQSYSQQTHQQQKHPQQSHPQQSYSQQTHQQQKHPQQSHPQQSRPQQIAEPQGAGRTSDEWDGFFQG